MTTTQGDTVDNYTIKHLHQYAEHICFDDEREGFISYTIAALEDDPGLADMGWPGMLKMYRRTLDQ